MNEIDELSAFDESDELESSGSPDKVSIEYASRRSGGRSPCKSTGKSVRKSEASISVKNKSPDVSIRKS